jgi:flagellar biosynthesis component FlhA
MKRSSAAIPAALVGVTLMMVIPVPPSVLDLLLSANITIGILVMLSRDSRSMCRRPGSSSPMPMPAR